MLLTNWLALFQARLKFSHFYRRRTRRALGSRPRREIGRLTVAAEVLEVRQLLTAVVTGVSPNQATTQGCTTVQIAGNGFTNVTAVMFGNTSAMSFNVMSGNMIMATAPSHTAGVVDIIVATSSGNSTPTSADQFTYTSSAPTVTGVGPSSGGTAGGTSVTITGTGFTGASAVMFGTSASATFTVNSATSITAMAPSHAVGMVDVTVVTSAGTSAINSSDHYTYSSTGPTVSSVSPGTGTGSGGTSVTITGTNFTNVSQVTFGGTSASSFTVNSQTQITATAPSHMAGTVDVVVVTSGGNSTTSSADQFVYTMPVSPPTVTGLGTTAGTTAGGTSVTILGTNFTNVSAVMFGNIAAQTFTVNSPTSITAVTPGEAAGMVDVKVTNSAGNSTISAADQYTFQSPGPAVNNLTITQGTTVGGTQVVISGSNFMGATAVYFGTVAATSFTLNSPTSITAVAPAHAAGVVDVTVRTPNGTSATTAGDQYTFVTPGALPTVTALSTSSGSSSGGTTITITGTNFTSVTGVSFGSVAAAYYSVLSDTSINATSPAGSGAVDVTVTTTSGTSAASSADQFTYNSSSGGGSSAPTVLALSASSGSTSGGSTITIFGSGFLGATAVKFGTVAAASFAVGSDGSITAVAPPESAGPVDVTVQNSAGTSATVTGDRFTFTAPGGAPTITGLDVSRGSTASGTVVTIAGANFANVSSVMFGAVAAKVFLVTSSSSIVAVAPAAGAGTVDIRVIADAGATPASGADQFTFVAPASSGTAGSTGSAPPTTPTITSLSASAGALAGGDRITISGANLTGITGVYFGTVAAPSFVVNADGTLTAATPAAAAGTVDVTVRTVHRTSPVTAADRFTFAAPPAAPTVTGLSAAIGSTTGGAAVTISGTNFTQVTGVLFGDVPAAAFTVNANGTITATAPGHAAGAVDVTVTTTGGTSATSAADQFTFSTALPVVTALDIASGFTTGGETITLFGVNLGSATGVFFGNVAAQWYSINDDGTITAVAPAIPASAAGTVDVIVQSAIGPSAPSSADQFQYLPAGALPTVTSLCTTTGPAGGGSLVMIGGTNFADVTGVSFVVPASGGNPATAVASPWFQVLSTGALVARVPAASGTVSASGQVDDVQVTTAAGTSAATSADRYTYTIAAPSIRSLSAASAFTTGGETISVYGSNFSGTTGVFFGGVAAQSFAVKSNGLLTAVVPAHAAGVVDITIQNSIGTSATGTSDHFTLTPAGALPTVTALSTPSGSTYGGTVLTITGTNFTDVSGISFGTVAATNFSLTSPTTISVTAPAAAVGTVHVTVTTPSGTSAAATADQFTFTVSAPTVTGLSTSSGFSSGGESVTIYGTDLSQATGVNFGNTPASSFQLNADGSLTAVAPSASSGNVNVTVVTPGGTSSTSSATQYTITPSGSLPTVTALSSTTGSLAGGQTITMTGTNFTDVSAVKFGTVAATSFTVTSPTSLTVVTPAEAVGTVHVTVVTSAGTSATSSADQFTFQAAAPIVTGLSQSSGFSTGGERVVISGINLAGATAVQFVVGQVSQPAASFIVNPDGTISAVVPSWSTVPTGPIDVVVTTPSGTSATSPADQFTITPVGALPTVASLSVSTGSTAGGDIVTITGTNFTDVTGVSFGGIAARSFSIVSPTRITAFAPKENAGTVDVAVTTTAGASAHSAADLYTFAAPSPTISSLSAASGFSTGGDSITIYGSNLRDAIGVQFVVGQVSQPATSFHANPDGSLTVVTPALAAGTAYIRVQTPEGTTGLAAADQFTVTPAGAAPTVTSLSATSGSTAGGQMVVITGTNFTHVTGVNFGTQAAALYYVVSPTSIIALSPSAAAGSSNVTVTTSVGTSGASSATAYSATAPSGSGSSGSGSSTPPPPNQSYVVTPFGGVASQLGQAFETNSGLGTDGLMSSFTAPLPPTVPTLHPNYSYSMNYATGTSSWSMTDGGTLVFYEPMNAALGNGATMTGYWSDTVMFTVSEGGSSGGGSSSSHTHIVRGDSIVMYSQYTAADGTGYTRTSNSDNGVTYDAISSNGTTTYSVDTNAYSESTNYQQGVSAQGASDQATERDTASGNSTSHLGATVSGGLATVTYTNTSSGNDHYSETDVANSAASTENDLLTGSDTWSKGNSGSFQQNADGTYLASNESGVSGSGMDVYSFGATQIVTSSSAATDGGMGGTSMIDSGWATDTGQDSYSVSALGSASRAVDGTITSAESHNDTDDGSEEVKSGDGGIAATTETYPDGSTLSASDSFHDSNDDQSDYDDSDVESPSGSGGGGSDQFGTEDDDTDTFDTGDTPNVVLTSTSPAGAVTTITLSGSSSDGGTTRSHDDATDNETLPGPGSGETDKITFDNSSGSEDEASSGLIIKISTVGLAAANDYVNSTETITLTDNSSGSSGFDDPGTETDAPTGDTESDTLTDDSEGTDTLVIGDSSGSEEIIANPDGSFDVSTSAGSSTETITDGEQADDSEQHGASANGAPGSGNMTYSLASGLAAGSGLPGEIDTNHDVSNSSSAISDLLTGNSSFSITKWTPVTNGWLSTMFGDVSSGRSLISDTETDNDTEDDSESPNSGAAAGSFSDTDNSTENFSDAGGGTDTTAGFATLFVTDPATGVITNIFTGGTGTDSSSSSFGDNASDNTTGGSGGSSDNIHDTENEFGGDRFSNRSLLGVSVQGSAAPGTTATLSEQLILSDSGGDSESGSGTSSAPGSDSGGVTFQTGDNASVGGKSQSSVTSTENSDDGHGNTVNGTASESESKTIGAMASDSDNGRETFSEANDLPVSDNEADAEQENALAQTSDKVIDAFNGTFVNVDPTTGLTTTIVATGADLERLTDFAANGTTDAHTSAGTGGAGSDTISGNENTTQNANLSDNLALVITTVGTDAQGNQLNLLETTTFSDSETDNLSVADVESANGSDTETFAGGGQANGQIVDTLTGTVTSIDPATGVKSVASINVSITGSASEQSHDVETGTTAPGSPGSDVVNAGENGSTTVNWIASVQVTKTNPDGSAANPSTTTTDNGTDTIAWGTALSTDVNGQVIDSAAGSDAGNCSASDPSVGNSAWSVQVAVADAAAAPPSAPPATGGSAAPPTVTPPPTASGSTSATPVGGKIVATSPSGVMNPPKGVSSTSGLKIAPKAAPRPVGTSAANLRATLGSAAGRGAGIVGNILTAVQLHQGMTPEQTVAVIYVSEMEKLRKAGLNLSPEACESILQRGLAEVDNGFRPSGGTMAETHRQVTQLLAKSIGEEIQAQRDSIKAKEAQAQQAKPQTAAGGAMKPPGRRIIQNHHAIPYDNKTWDHHNHPLVKQADVNLEEYAPNQKDLEGHLGRHTTEYNREIKRRLDEAYARVKGKGEQAAVDELNAVLQQIWDDIASGKLKPYKTKDVNPV